MNHEECIRNEEAPADSIKAALGCVNPLSGGSWVSFIFAKSKIFLRFIFCPEVKKLNSSVCYVWIKKLIVWCLHKQKFKKYILQKRKMKNGITFKKR